MWWLEVHLLLCWLVSRWLLLWLVWRVLVLLILVGWGEALSILVQGCFWLESVNFSIKFSKNTKLEQEFDV